MPSFIRVTDCTRLRLANLQPVAAGTRSARPTTMGAIRRILESVLGSPASGEATRAKPENYSDGIEGALGRQAERTCPTPAHTTRTRRVRSRSPQPGASTKGYVTITLPMRPGA